MSPAWAGEEPSRSFADVVKGLALVPAGAADSEMLAKASAAVAFIRKMELPEAHQAINEALQLDARNAHLHFLNGFIYHLQAKQGDTQKAEIAIEGYQQALRIDPGNWIAQEFLGLAYMDLKQFDRAKAQFAGVLMLTPESTVSLQGLMVSSYLTGDASTACAMADQFRKVSVKPHLGFVRSSIPVYASCGNFEQADRMLTGLGAGGADTERVDKRLAQWKSFYQRQAPAGAVFVKASALSPERFAQAFTLPNLGSRPSARPPTESAETPAPVESAAAAPSASPVVPRADAGSEGPRMVLIDVVLLSTQELVSTSKGVNLLSALTLQLGAANNVPGYSWSNNSSSTNGGPSTTSTAITRAVTIPALSYSLNIANANSSVNEVLARPTLAAIEGLPSEFFSGTNLSAGVVSTSTQGGTTIVPLDKRFGIKLAVTPVFLPQGQVQLKVEAQRTSLNASAENSRVAYQIEIGETTANANVVMKLGDTLVLSGLSEKTSSSTRDGVPGLQDVPGLQYLFSNKKTNDIQRSVLILVTPRSPVQIAEADPVQGGSMLDAMKALRERFGLAASIPANVEAVMNQMKPNDFFREFRQGDVSMERWDRMRTTGERLQEALGFLYY
ncbi:MAG: secretion protein [Aquabacterium sp.]|uniref:secretion protein n=1 Tax=Aquabacterium sp. TaxID=1872578 RepID=UPI00271C0E8F|nr:secretion protein [Aquabacterium sp.]MDO9002402.1 secretion protein [Aquabacterium sp.]